MKKTSNHRQPWTRAEIKALKAASKARIPLPRLSKEFKRTIGALRQRAHVEGFGLGDRNRAR